MPTRRYALSPSGPAQLSVRWEGAWRDLEARLGDQVVLSVRDGHVLRTPAEVPLSDGSRLSFELIPGSVIGHLRVCRDGVELPAAREPEDVWVRRAVTVMFVVAMVHGLLGLLAAFFEPPALYELGFDETSLALALLYVLTATAVERSRSLLAVGVALGVYLLDLAFALALHRYEAHSAAPTLGLLVRVILMLPLVRGALSVYLVRKRKQTGLEGAPVSR